MSHESDRAFARPAPKNAGRAASPVASVARPPFRRLQVSAGTSAGALDFGLLLRGGGAFAGSGRRAAWLSGPAAARPSEGTIPPDSWHCDETLLELAGAAPARSSEGEPVAALAGTRASSGQHASDARSPFPLLATASAGQESSAASGSITA